MIYFAQPSPGGFIKIGTTRCLTDRLAGLKSEYGILLTILAVVDGGHPEEASLHSRFSHLRSEGEWFHPGDDLLEFISKEAKPWDGSDETPKTTTKVFVSLIRRARMVSDHRGIDLFDYIDSLLSPAVEQDYRRLIESEAKRIGE